MEIKIELLKHTDLKRYYDLLDNVLGVNISLEKMQAKFKEDNPSLKVVVAKNGLEIIGTISFVLIDSFTSASDPRIEFFNFAVGPAARGSDAARLLMDYVTDYAIEFGFNQVAVNCLKDAARAHSFYEKMGFVRDEKMRFVKLLSPDDVVD